MEGPRMTAGSINLEVMTGGSRIIEIRGVDSYGVSPDKCRTQHPFASAFHGGHTSFVSNLLQVL